MRWIHKLIGWFVVPPVQWFNWHIRRKARCGRCRVVMKREEITSVGVCANCYWDMLKPFDIQEGP